MVHSTWSARWLGPMIAGAILGCSHPQPTPQPVAQGGDPPARSGDICDQIPLDFQRPVPPLDFEGTLPPGPLPADKTALAAFAWQHFVALNWPASYPEDSVRGTPSNRASFLHPPDGPFTTVWQTYRNKNEMFPAGSQNGTAPPPDADYRKPPRYRYENLAGPCTPGDTNPSELINLDENSQLGLAYMFAQPDGASDPQEVLFLAKVNQVNYDYIVRNGLYDLSKEEVRTSANLQQGLFGLCQQTDAQRCGQDPNSPVKSYCLPCGGTAPGASSEGTIHVKAAWRRLTQAEAGSGRYFTAPVVIYKKQGDKVCYSNDKDNTWGLVGLHIIHKTVRFPTFFFATWEHEDSIKSHLKVRNTAQGGPRETEDKLLDYERVKNDKEPLPSFYVDFINNCVTAKIAAASLRTPWSHYRLVGVQGPPVDYDNRVDALGVAVPEYYLANDVIESNKFFQTFLGNKGTYSGDPNGTRRGTNVKTRDGHSYDVGGCQGCHGNSQLGKGLDMSFISAGFPKRAEAIDDFTEGAGRASFYFGK